MIGAAFGVFLGLLTGGLTHGALYYVRDERDSVFYGVWGVGFLTRMATVAAVIWWLLGSKSLPVLPTTIAMILGQMAVQMIPIRPDRMKLKAAQAAAKTK